MFWNEERKTRETTDTVVENEEMEDFAQLEDEKKEALKWVEAFPNSNYV